MEFVQLYSFDIDFQRDIRKGNKIKIFFEIYEDSQNNYIKSGTLIFQRLFLMMNPMSFIDSNQKGMNLLNTLIVMVRAQLKHL